MLKRLRTLTRSLVAALNIAAIVLMLFAGFSGYISPERMPLAVPMGLAFPVLVVINALFIVLWIVISPRRVVIPLLGFIVAYIPVRTYCPLNIRKAAPEGALKVLSYNVQNLDKKLYPLDDDGFFPALSYVKQQDADIVCLQECTLRGHVINGMSQLYQYIDSVHPDDKAASVTLMSKYPILKKERIYYPSKGNSCAAFFLSVDGDTVVVINGHLETNGFTLDERDEFGIMVSEAKSKIKEHNRPEMTDTMRTTTRILLAKIEEAAAKRAPQARAIARYIDSIRHLPVIVCGDFNDNPLSYAHRTVAHHMTDCYIESGNGPGWSYNKNSMRVRIDNILCSKHYKPYQCAVDKSVTASDHYPMVCYLVRTDD